MNPNYGDDGLNEVAEFQKAFNCRIAPAAVAPGKMSSFALAQIHRFMVAAADLAEDLKGAAKAARDLGDEEGALALIRLQLSQEELAELGEALYRRDVVGMLDALTDMDYVSNGTFLTYGLAAYKVAARREVHRSNMSKLDDDGKPIIGPSGRVVKSDNYSPPNLAGLFEIDVEF